MTKEYLDLLYSQVESSQVSALLLQNMCQIPERRLCHMELIKTYLVHSSIRSRQGVRQKLIMGILRLPDLGTWFLENMTSFMDLPVESPHYLEAILSLSKMVIFQQNRIPVSLPKTLTWEDFMSEEMMERALHADDIQIRLAAWNLLADHPKSVWPCTSLDLKLAQRFLTQSMGLILPVDREHMFLPLKKMFYRIQEHSRVLVKKPASSAFTVNDPSVITTYLKDYTEFLQFLESLAFSSLRTDIEAEQDDQSRFSRRISALTLIELLYMPLAIPNHSYSSLVQCLNLKHWMDSTKFELLLRCLDSEFELAQSLALRILSYQVVNEDFLGFDFKAYLNETKELFILPPRLDERVEHLAFSTVFGTALYQTISHRLHFCFIGPEGESAAVDLFDELLRHLEALNSSATSIGLPNRLETLYNPLLAIQAILHCNEKNVLANTVRHIFDSESVDNDAVHANRKRPADQLVSCCFTFAKLVEPIVHSLTPEGLIPADFDHKSPLLHQQNTKYNQYLSERLTDFIKLNAENDRYQRYVTVCWRIHATLSAIFARIITLMPSVEALPPLSRLHQIGQYFWLQLTACRHCGAFQAAAEAFHDVCTRFWQFSALAEGESTISISGTDETDLSRLANMNSAAILSPRLWLNHIITLLTSTSNYDTSHSSEANNLKFCSIARRSAGLPHLVHAIASTEPNCTSRQKDALNFAAHNLLKACLSLSQLEPEFEVHCVNVLRSLFSSTVLREPVLAHAERAFTASIHGTSSSNWQIRNAYNQLFAALVRRIFGTPSVVQTTVLVEQRCKLSAVEFFSRYPSIYQVIHEKLRLHSCLNDSSNHSFYSTFAVLILLIHLHPSGISTRTAVDVNKARQSLANSSRIQKTNFCGSYELTIFVSDILRLLFSVPSHKLRELAAAALLSIVRPPELLRVLRWLHRNLSQHFSFHGCDDDGKTEFLPKKESLENLKPLNWNTVDAILILLFLIKELGYLGDYNTSEGLISLNRSSSPSAADCLDSSSAENSYDIEQIQVLCHQIQKMITNKPQSREDTSSEKAATLYFDEFLWATGLSLTRAKPGQMRTEFTPQGGETDDGNDDEVDRR